MTNHLREKVALGVFIFLCCLSLSGVGGGFVSGALSLGLVSWAAMVYIAGPSR